MTASSAATVSERAWEVPSLRVGGALPELAEYPEYVGLTDTCDEVSDGRRCSLAVHHPGDLHAATSLSGVIVAVWDEPDPWMVDW